MGFNAVFLSFFRHQREGTSGPAAPRPSAALKLAAQKWYTPGGGSIQDTGITPDVVVEEKREMEVMTQVMDELHRGLPREPNASADKTLEAALKN